MKHVFIINPSSGRKNARKRLLESLRRVADDLQLDYELYFTKAPKDGGKHAAGLCRELMEKGRRLRIYGCGGDGTLNELVNGVYGFDNVELGVIPTGTGNDYVRNYGEVSDFLDLKSQILGESVASDLIKYTAHYNGEVTEGYCANMFNIGFDCNVVDMTDKVKRIPLLNGPLAYLVSVAIILIRKKGANLRIEYEDGSVVDGKLLLAAIANGCYCGGGVKGVPRCRLDDGLMDVSVISDIGRLLFISLFPSYADGKHLENRRVVSRNILRYTKEKKLTITANGESMRLCTDGEVTTQKRVEFSMVKDAFRFIVPLHLR